MAGLLPTQTSNVIAAVALATSQTFLTPTSSSSDVAMFPPSAVSTAIISQQQQGGNGSGNGNGDGDRNNGECQLLGPFALLVQAALGAIALLSLVYKRWRERPQRPVKVWAFDVSKQVFGSVLLHLANLLASMFSAGQIPVTATYQPNPCSYYLLNLGIDTTFGIPILILLLRILNRAALYTPLANPPESIESGNYGDPPHAVWWFKQSLIYFFGLLCMKTCVVVLIHMLPFIVKIGDWALRWTEGNTAVQIFFVMLLFPVIMNAVQYYIIDIFIKKPIPVVRHERIPGGDPDDDDGGGYSGLDDAGMADDDDRHRRSALLAGIDDEDTDLSSDDGDHVVFPDQNDEATVKRSFEAGGKGNGPTA
ncbi:hypothetical protein AJ78_08335 [Emergomyces pasteurianus Ep9510]|uniref:Vacuolar membrane protein n=1 Tax=Emergomyces pasteurianus Ep9510 TaxID=1447872 RepID=A0A1J9Q6F2_9EURO|nr:hypothetical protein AJ78_08335 [Emergomyces pasteurianus Ep9510]